ncbi:VENN motif pre-toxin domain-containing protein [Proteus penneri]|uniref:VENN motif pre-toxin domain-containing protein n=1 Tax=Proteus penneri TaxID=102862 RepID=UPI0018D7475B|nr:VENN motif pre-toxin domain-containing protein [Proteus penneri]QPT32499.1 VENN motif pre-toxin domain-containing protein [Proteus penneri]
MAQYGTDSDFQKAAQAVTGLLQGLAGDNLAGALASASSPHLATLIKQQVGEDNKAANAMAHAVLGAVVAELNNQSAAAGGLGAGGGELAARYIAKELFPNKDVSELTESEKQQVSALSQLASGLAGGLTTGDIAGAITGSQAGKNAVENNFLHSEQIMSFVDAQAKTKTPEERKQLQKDIDTLDKQLQSQAERWGISTNDMKSALDSLKTLEGLPDCNAQCQDMVKDSISKLEPALENRIAKHSSQTENLKELTGILATVIVLNESGLIDGNSKGNNTSSVVTKPNVTTTKPNEQVPPKTVPNQTGGDKLGNYQVHDLKQVTDPALNLDSIRNATQQYLKKPLQQDGAAVSYATASVTVNGKTEYYLSVSGKSWSGKSPDTVNIDGVTYKVIRDDKNSFTSVGNIESKRTNFNHAEQKLFNHIQDAYKGQKADVNMAIQNTSNRDPGMCVSCGYTSKNFAENNKDLNVKIYQGSTGENK